MTIAVGVGRDDLITSFRSVRLARVFRSPSGIDNDENGTSIWVCSGQRAPWPAIWAAFCHHG